MRSQHFDDIQGAEGPSHLAFSSKLARKSSEEHLGLAEKANMKNKKDVRS
jgi:hypothetical protein